MDKFNEKILLNNYPQLKDALNGKFVYITGECDDNDLPAAYIRTFLHSHKISYEYNSYNNKQNVAGLRPFIFIINEVNDDTIENYYI